MDDHLAKPFALDALAHALSRAKPPRDATPHASVLDPEVVDQLRSLAQAGNSELLDKLQDSFTRDTPIRLAALRAAVAPATPTRVAFNVHTLKGSAANLGRRQIVATCQLIESLDGSARRGRTRAAAGSSWSAMRPTRRPSSRSLAETG